MADVEQLTDEGGDPMILENNVGGGEGIIVEPFEFGNINNMKFFLVGNGMMCSEIIR